MSEEDKTKFVVEAGADDALPLALRLEKEGQGQTLAQIFTDAEAQVEKVKRIKVIAIGVTNEDDWTSQDGKPYLGVMGSMKVGQLFQVSIIDQKKTSEVLNDDAGAYIVITISGRAKFAGREIFEVGACSTRDPLFGKKDGGYRPLEEVDITDVEKKAMTNLHNRILKKILGLSFTWEDLKKAGLNIEKIQKDNAVNRKNHAPEATPEDLIKRDEIRNWLIEMNGTEAKAKEELEKISAFKGGDGKQVAGVKSPAQLHGVRLNINHSKVKKLYEEWKKAHGASGGENGEN